MDVKQAKVLELNQILERISSYALTARAKSALLALEPVCDVYHIRRCLDILGEAVRMQNLRGQIPLYGYDETEALIVHAQKGGVVREGGLLQVACALRIAGQLRRYVFHEDEPHLFLLLEEIAEGLDGIVSLEKDISAAVLSETELSDSASPALSDIRRAQRTAAASIRDKLNSIINSAQTKKYLQDSIVTVRGGRYVVPVKSESRGQIDGIIHDSSSSGMTVFIEPAAVVSLNNRLRELEIEEQKEIDRILKMFSQRLAYNAPALLHNERVICELDGYFAKAAYAADNGHTKPEIIEERRIDLKKARHPLIALSEAVASDIYLGGAFTQIVITGPNTGGKTVTLKTVGLICLMVQCGLFISAAEGSRLAVFGQIFADIGDEQSIAQSLSTFSAHMTNIISILKNVTPDSLVLFDELGAGTDPSEGAALAQAILSKVKSAGALSIATTHYNEIKKYALTAPGAVNASVEFDVVNLKPTYRLVIGVPGKSNAFEISRRLGLGEDVISAAAATISSDNVEFEKILADLQEKLTETQQASVRAQRLESANIQTREKLESDLRRLSQAREKFLADAAVEAKKVLADAKNTAKEIIAETEKFAKTSSGSDVMLIRRKISDMADAAAQAANEMIPQHALHKKAAPSNKPDDFKINDDVHVPDLNAAGVILSIDGDDALVQIGAIKTRVALPKLARASRQTQKSYAYTGMKAQSASARLDIRGITGTEVSMEIEKFLDDAALAGLKVLTIIHGKGSGVLKRAAQEALNSHPLVEKHRSGGLKEGGDGATIVYLS